jgi:hypothetical protein
VPASAVDPLAAAALNVRQRTLQAQLALAAAQAPEELPLDGLSDDDDDENDNNAADEQLQGGPYSLPLRGGPSAMEQLAAADGADDDGNGDTDDPVDTLFARPWSAHARSLPSARARTSGVALRPQSAARGRMEQHAERPEEEYASFALPLRGANTATTVSSHPAASSLAPSSSVTAASAAANQSALQKQLRGNVYAQAFATAATVSNGGANSSSVSQSALRGSPSVGQLVHRPGAGAGAASYGAQTPRGSLPVSTNPFLLKTALFSAQQ